MSTKQINNKIISAFIQIIFSPLLLRLFFLLCLVNIFTNCASEKEDTTIIPPPSKIPKDGVLQKKGSQSFVYKSYVPLANKPVTVFYYIPTKGDITKMPILFSMHGSDRNAQLQRNAWKYFAQEYEFIVLAPELSHENGYGENNYQFGAVFTSSNFSTLNSEDKWTYNLIESLFDYVKKEIDNTQTQYHIFGHSAGGQFVHRFLLATPNARVNKAIAANPGSWTFPYTNGIMGSDQKFYGWPYSIKDTPFNTENHLKSFFSKNLNIQLGELDLETSEDTFPNDIPSLTQGEHRLARGRYFYEESLRIAQNLKTPIFFKKYEVANAGHSTLRMVYGKAVSDSTDVKTIGANSAYNILFN